MSARPSETALLAVRLPLDLDFRLRWLGLASGVALGAIVALAVAAGGSRPVESPAKQADDNA